jgi:hypothetical protein
MFAIWGLLVLAGIFVAVRFTGLIDQLLPAGDPPNVTFAPEAALPQTRNYFVACPAGRLPETPRSMQSPQFDVSVATLTDLMVETAPDHGMRMVLNPAGGKPGRLYFLARSTVFRFPDWVEIELVLSDDDDSVTFCLFAQSVYGLDDVGQNEKRTRAWLDDVVARMGQDG